MGIEQKQFGRRPRNIRSQNRKLIIDLYRQYDELSVSDISNKIKLSRTTVMNINQELLAERIIIASGKGESTGEGGKKPRIYKFFAEKQYIITFYIKHEVVLFVLYNLKYQSIIEDSLPILKNSRLQDVIRKMQAIIRRNIFNNSDFAEVDLLACIVGVHGNMDLNTGICKQSTYFSSWGTDNNLFRKLTEKFKIDCPIYVDHWIRLRTYGESRLGLVGLHDSIVLIDAGWHGVVSGIMLKGKLYTGKHFLSGEIGHFRINPEDTEPCLCGSHGCFEQQVSLERLFQNILKNLVKFPESILADKDIELDLQRIFYAADMGDKFVQCMLDDVIYWFSLMISYLILFFDPEIIYFEGDFTMKCKYFDTGLKKKIKELALPRLKRKNVLQLVPKGADSVLIGAAIFAFDRYFQLDSGETELG